MVGFGMCQVKSQVLWGLNGKGGGEETVRWQRNSAGHKRKPETRKNFVKFN